MSSSRASQPQRAATQQWLMVEAAMLLSSFGLASAYALHSGLSWNAGQSNGFWIVVKSSSVLLLALLCAMEAGRSENSGRTAGTLACGLFAHSIGDAVIAAGQLLPAMAAFFVGHLFYCAAFLKTPATVLLAGWRRALTLFWPLFGVGFVALLWPHLDSTYRVAVPVYSAVLLGMAVAATRSLWAAAVVLAAALYVFSDSTLGYDQFATPLTWSKWTTWPTYFLAQVLFWSVARSSARAST